MANTTIYEIAEEAGCSPSTVSRVINGYPHVRKTTRSKVLKIIEEKKFVPNETARNLVTQSSRMIGILVSDIRTTQHTDGIYYIEKELSKRGYSSIICNTGANEDSMVSYIQMLSQRNVDAVIIMGSIYQNDAVEKAIALYIPDIPVVLCKGVLNGNNIYSIVSDEDTGVYNSVMLLYKTGVKNPAFIYDYETPSNLKKKQGFIKALKELGFEERTMNIPGETEEMYKAIKDYIVSNPEIDGIIFSEDFIAVVALQVFFDMKIKVPDKMEIIGVNNSRFALVGIPTITSLDNKLYDTSITAVRTVLSLLEGESASHKVLLFSEIIKRRTTRSID